MRRRYDVPKMKAAFSKGFENTALFSVTSANAAAENEMRIPNSMWHIAGGQVGLSSSSGLHGVPLNALSALAMPGVR